MRKGRTHAVELVAVGLLCVTAPGCSDIVKQTIVSSVNTGIGASLTQNPQTQLYEVKIGYIRTQFYSVPTGKMFCSKEDAAAGCKSSNDAGVAPQLVSGIRMHSGVEQLLLGIDVSENFAVGERAVNSPAAVAMYIANADTDAKASAAALAANAKSTTTISAVPSGDIATVHHSIVAAYTAADTTKQQQIESIVTANGYASWNAFLAPETTHDLSTLKSIKAAIDQLH